MVKPSSVDPPNSQEMRFTKGWCIRGTSCQGTAQTSSRAPSYHHQNFLSMLCIDLHSLSDRAMVANAMMHWQDELLYLLLLKSQ